jgi:hypothetical protein
MTADGRFNAGTYQFCDFHRTMAAIMMLRSGLRQEKAERILSRFVRCGEASR